MADLKVKISIGTASVLLTTAACINQHSEKSEEKPNILWIFLEDTSPFLKCYGNSTVSTPNIDRLVENGVVFSNAYMHAPVSSACRSGLITGTMATTFGLHNHHSSRTEESAINLPSYVKTIPELFKSHGYFTFNNGKDDYNFMYSREHLYSQNYFEHPIYGKSGERLSLDSLKNKQPFFGQIQLYGGKEIFSNKFKERVKHPVNRDNIVLPPYLPYNDVIIEEYANHLDAISITDERVGEILEQLERNRLLNNTIIFFFSDHGMRLTRHKQFLYDGGIHVPLIIASFKNETFKSGSVRDDLVSGIDIGPSSMALAGIEIPEYIEGVNFLAEDYHPREHVISTRDRCDFSIDRIRAIRTNRYKYIRNFMTDRPYLQTTYMNVDSVAFVLEIEKLYREGKLDSIQARFCSDEKPAEELYDIIADPFEINNLAAKPEYKNTLDSLAAILDNWIKVTDDKGQYPESEAGLKFMYGIWGKFATNPEYDILREKYTGYEGSLFALKSSKWEKPENDWNKK